MKETYSRGKHLEEKSNKLYTKKNFFLTILFVVFTFLIVSIPSNEKLQQEIGTSNYIENNSNENMLEENVIEVSKVDMPSHIENYDVIGELVIEKIDFKNYILGTTTDDSLKFSVTKFYGPDVNQKGNLCITGHNTKEELFKKIKELEKEDTFYIIDNQNFEKVTYRIYNKYTSKPTDLTCLNQETNDKREVTLITCNPRRFN